MMFGLCLPRVARSRRRSAPTRSFFSGAAPRLRLESLEPRRALCGVGCLEVELIPELDQFGSQLETVMAYRLPGETDLQTRVTFGIYDTGASVVTFSAGDQLLFELFGNPIPIKVEDGASADAIGGVLTGDVSLPGEIIAGGLHTVAIDPQTFEVTVSFDPVIDLDGDGVPDPTAVNTPGVQAFVGTTDGSPILPTITGTVVHNPTISHPNGVAVQVNMTAYQLDFGALFPEIPEFEGIVVDLPDLYFVEPGTTLTTPDPAMITNPVRIPLELWGENNYADPGDLITTTPNPVQTAVRLQQGVMEVTDQTLLFDTGAQLSVISTEIAEGLGLDLNNPETTITVQGAAGQATIPGYTLDVLEFPRDDDGDGVIDGVLQFTNAPIYVLDVVPGLGGLIGMNLFNTAKEMLYDPFDPDGPSLQLTFFVDPFREIPDPGEEDPEGDALDMLISENPLFGEWIGGQALPSFGIEVPPPVNLPPQAIDDDFDVDYDVASPLDVLSNDTDLDGDALSIIDVSDPVYGTATIGAGVVTYTPDVGYSGADSFTYTISDGNGGEATATVTLTVQPPPNNDPQAVDDDFDVPAEIASSLDVLSNDADLDGDALSIIDVSDPVYGTATIGAGVVTYTPDAGYSGADSFTYTISDGNGGEATATITITVQPPPNNNPQAVDDDFDLSAEIASSLDVLANDTDLDGDALSIIDVSDPVYGTATIGAGVVTYTPDAGYSGADSFTYTISDGNGGEATATVTITVEPPPNTEPQAVDDEFDVPGETASSLNVLANDTDPDGDPLSIVAVTDPVYGAATIGASGGIVYTPIGGYTGVDSFTYTISDGKGGEATATVTLVVSIGNDPPVAVDDDVETDENTPKTIDVLANDSDPDGDPLEVIATTDPSHGSIVVAGDNTISYTPEPDYDGADSFTYTVSDGKGGEATATVTVVVNPVQVAHPWQNPNPDLRWDVDGNGAVAIGDLLALVIALREHGLDYVLPPPGEGENLPLYPDVDGDDRLDLGDLLAVVQNLRENLAAPPGGEGEDEDIAAFGPPGIVPLEDLLDGIARDIARRS